MNDERDLTKTPGAPRPADDDLRWALGVGLVTPIAFGLGGFFLVYDQTGSMGWVLSLLCVHTEHQYLFEAVENKFKTAQ